LSGFPSQEKENGQNPNSTPIPDARGADPRCLGTRMSLFFGLEYVLPVFVEMHQISVRRKGGISGKVLAEPSSPIVSSISPACFCSRPIAPTGWAILNPALSWGSFSGGSSSGVVRAGMTAPAARALATPDRNSHRTLLGRPLPDSLQTPIRTVGALGEDVGFSGVESPRGGPSSTDPSRYT
jgi:hypothetical protein